MVPPADLQGGPAPAPDDLNRGGSQPMARPPSAPATRLFMLAGGLSLALLFGLRLYAALATVHPETPWDDRHYRQMAIEEAAATTWPQALARVLLPNSRPFGIRTVGYHDWLVLGQKAGAAAGVGPALALQWTNVLMLLIQAAAVAALAGWATASHPFALLVASLFLSAPMVFGINRWVITENLVVTGMLVGPLAAAWLLARPSRPRRLAWRLGRAAIAAYALGLFATTREYAVPALGAIGLCTLVALLVERRWGQAAVYAGVLSPFVLAVWGPAGAALSEFFAKGEAVRGYFHPLDLWLTSIFWHGLGPPLTVLLLAGLGALAVFAVKELAGGGIRWSGLHLLLAGLAGFAAVYTWGVATTWVRVVRPVLMPLLLALALLAVALRLLPGFRRAALATRTLSGLTVLLAAAWIVLVYQLAFAFEGGRAYVFGPWGPEVWNHPLGLRELVDAEDSHAETPEQARARLAAKARGRQVELARRLEELRTGPDPAARRALIDDLRQGLYDTRPLAPEALSAVNLTEDGWTGAGAPAGLLAVNTGSEPLSVRVRANCPAPAADLPLRLFVDDGDTVREIPFTEPGGVWLDLPAVEPGAAALYLLWTDRTWTPGPDDPRRLGVRLKTVRVRRRE